MVCIQLFIHWIVAIGIFNKFTSELFQNITNLLTNWFLETFTPIIAMNHIIWLQLTKILCIRKSFLLDYTFYSGKILD